MGDARAILGGCSVTQPSEHGIPNIAISSKPFGVRCGPFVNLAVVPNRTIHGSTLTLPPFGWPYSITFLYLL
jgi:hypothetical protein